MLLLCGDVFKPLQAEKLRWASVAMFVGFGRENASMAAVELRLQLAVDREATWQAFRSHSKHSAKSTSRVAKTILSQPNIDITASDRASHF